MLKEIKVLIVYASFGEGHKKAAHALRSALHTHSCDLLDFSPSFIKKIYSLSYIIITQYFPCLWHILFFLAKKSFFSSFVDKIHRLIFFSFSNYLRQVKPNVIIITHFFPSTIIESLKKELGIKVICVITDLRVYPLWVNRAIDYYFAVLDKTKEDLLKLGVMQDKIITGCFPLREGFLKETAEERLRKKFHLNLRPTVLFVSSLRGKFPFLKKSIQSLLGDFNIFVIYGKNHRLKKYLQRLNSPYIQYFSSYDEIWHLMQLSPVVVTKPGGLTVFEGIYKKKYFIFTHYIPGQEKQNMDLLVKYDVAKFVRSRKELTEAIHYFENKYSKMKNNYPIAIKDIREPLIDLIKKLGFV